MAITTQMRTDVANLYVALFGRAPERDGLGYWVQQLDAGKTVAQVAQEMYNTTPARAFYPEFLTNDEIVGRFYTNVLGRTADADGLAYWAAKLGATGATKGSVIAEMITAVRAYAGSDAAALTSKALFENKVTVGLYYAVDLGGNDVTTATNILTGVTSSATSVDAAKSGATTVAGSTFTLTTAADTTTGTTGNDVINASIIFDATELATTASTFTVADQINGSSGTDTLKLTVSGAQDATVTIPAASISGVEVLDIRNTVAQTASVDVSNFAGVTNVNADRSVGAVTVTNLAASGAAGIIGDGTVVGGALNFGYAAATSAATLNVSNGANAGNVAITSTPASVTINSTGANNKIGTVALGGAATALTVNAATHLQTGNITGFTGTSAKITVSGAATNKAATATAGELGAVTLGTIENTTVKTIDASGLTAGGIEAVLNTNTTISVKGGAGNDDITTGSVLTTGSVDAGAGSADVLEIAAGGTHVADATLGAKYSNFEVLRLNDTQDVSFVSGITALELNAMTAKTVSKISAAQAGAITVKGDQATSLTLTLADATGSSDTVSLTLKSDTAANNVDVAALSVIGVETLNIAATSGTAATSSDVSFGVGGADKLTAINISGTADVGLVGTNTAKAVTVTSTTSGKATISGNFVSGSSITTGAGADAITLGTGFGTYNTGAGNDGITATVAQLNTGATYNVLNGGDGTDTLTINNGANTAVTIVDNNLSKISNIEKVVVSTSGTANQSITTGGWFDGAFKANGVDLTTTATTGNITIDMTSFTGAAKITATTVGTGAGEGAVNIQTGAGNDTVTVSNAALGDAGVISTYDGNDTIVGGADAETITGGKGTDTMTGGGTTANTYVFAAGDTGGVPSATAFDTIKDFTAVAGNVINAGAASIVTNATATSGVAAISAAGVATFHAADTSFALHLVAVEAAINAGGVAAAGQAAMWQEGTDAFLFVSDGVDGIGANDLLIKLVGLDTTAAAFDTLTDGGTTFTIA
jgi:hypothetical protein